MGEHWQRMDCVGHTLSVHFSVDLRAPVLSVKHHRLAGPLARKSQCSLPFQKAALRDLAWWRKQQSDWTKVEDKCTARTFLVFTAGAGKRVLNNVSNLHPDPRTVTQLSSVELL